MEGIRGKVKGTITHANYLLVFHAQGFEAPWVWQECLQLGLYMGKKNNNVFDNFLVLNNIIPGLCNNADPVKQDFQAGNKDIEETTTGVIALAKDPAHHPPGQLQGGKVHHLKVRTIVLPSLLTMGVEERGNVDGVHLE